jgi:DNA-binding SARP family transcriptional activator
MHEGIAAHLMLALYRTGQPARALQYFEGLRHRLAENLGADPGPELAGLQLQMLRRQVPTSVMPAYALV